MSDKQTRITKALFLNDVLKTSEIAEYSGVPAEECEEILRKMEDLSEVFAVGSDSWQLN